jgi:hypothetical protein
LARQRGLPVLWLRAAFAAAVLIGGLGLLVYLACWLIIPADTEDEAAVGRTPGIVVLAQACAGGVGLATLGGAAAAATIFGFGLAVLIVASAILVGALVSWPRVGPVWTLLPLAALVVPAVAMAAGGVRIAPQSADVAIAPRSAVELSRGAYRTGLGTLMLDLRHTALPATGVVGVNIDAGLRRTIVALPADRCVYVDLRYRVAPFAARLAALLGGGRDSPYSEVTLFGTPQGTGWGEAGNLAGAPGAPLGPTLEIHFHSAGGSLYVRDYPDAVNPESQVDWPGYPVVAQTRPDTTGVPRAAGVALIRNWLTRRRVQRKSASDVNRLMPGPCGAVTGAPR